MKRHVHGLGGLLAIILLMLACSLTTEAPAPTALPPTHTPVATVVGQTSPTPATPTATFTQTPPPATPTTTPLPTATPFPEVRLAYDRYRAVDVPSQLANGLESAWVAYRHVNEREARVDARTPQAETGMQTIYLARPDTGQRTQVLEVPSTVEGDIFWSPDGLRLLYFVREGAGVPAADAGLYMFDLTLGVTLRFYAISTLQPRGISNHQPVWSPDSRRFLMVLPAGYATDIFTVNVDGSGFTALVDAPAYDFWPVWSPDGEQVAFVSDRDQCPTWQPNIPDTCYTPDAPAPRGGHLYVLNVASGDVRQVTSTLVTGPPRWLNNRYITAPSGSRDPLASDSVPWLFDLEAGSAWPVAPRDGAIYAAPAWTGDITQVAYQRVGDTSSIVVADQVGEMQASLTEYQFPRFGVTLSWSPSGDFLAIGGRNGQCPYGLIVVNRRFELVTAPARNLLACEPVYAPTGRYMAFTGIRSLPGTDARQDIYVANLNGLGATNITSSLQGQVHLLGWVGPSQLDSAAP